MSISPDCNWSIETKRRFRNGPPQNAFSMNSDEFEAASILSELSRLIALQIGRSHSWQFDVVKKKWVKLH